MFGSKDAGNRIQHSCSLSKTTDTFAFTELNPMTWRPKTVSCQKGQTQNCGCLSLLVWVCADHKQIHWTQDHCIKWHIEPSARINLNKMRVHFNSNRLLMQASTPSNCVPSNVMFPWEYPTPWHHTFSQWNTHSFGELFLFLSSLTHTLSLVSWPLINISGYTGFQENRMVGFQPQIFHWWVPYLHHLGQSLWVTISTHTHTLYRDAFSGPSVHAVWNCIYFCFGASWVAHSTNRHNHNHCSLHLLTFTTFQTHARELTFIISLYSHITTLWGGGAWWKEEGAKSKESGVQLPGFKSWLYQLPTLWHGANFLTSLCRFPISKRNLTIASIS